MLRRERGQGGNQRDVQLARRFEELPLTRWSAQKGFEQLVLAIILNLPLREPTVLSARAARKILRSGDRGYRDRHRAHYRRCDRGGGR